MIYKFSKEISYEYITVIDAHSLEEALEQLKQDDVEWEEASGGEALISNRHIYVYENEECFEEDDTIDDIDEDTMSEKDIWF